MTTRKQTAIVGLKVRLREPLRKKLEVAAKQRGVSLNAELVSRLEQSFQAGDLTEAVRREFQNYLRLVVRGQKWPTRREQAVERLVGEHQALPGEKGEQRWRKAREALKRLAGEEEFEPMLPPFERMVPRKRGEKIK